MRLTDECQILRQTGQPYGDPRRCSFGHTAGEAPFLEGHVGRYKETARVIVGPDEELVQVANPNGWQVVHKTKTYNITGVLPRYRSHGRLHHISLDLEAVYG